MNPNPQTENGYVKIANELAEQLGKLHLSGNEWQIVWVILRKTWGWNKKSDRISLTQFEEATGLSRPRVHSAIKKLVRKSVLVAKRDTFIIDYAFNKLYSQWTSSEKRTSTFMRTRVVRKSGTKLVRKSVHTKDNKDTIQKTILPNGNMVKDQYGNKYVEYVLEAFKKNVGAYPIEDNRRNIAHNIVQITGTFIKKHGDKYLASRGNSPTFTSLIDKSWVIYNKNNEGTTTRRLKTFKQHYKFMLEKLESELSKL